MPNPKVLKGEAAMKEYRKQISPKGMAAAEAAARKALENRYPGMFIPETKIAPNSNNKYSNKGFSESLEKIIKNSKKTATENTKKVKDQKKKPKINRDPRFDLTN